MARFRVSVRTNYGELSVESETIDDLRNALHEIGISKENMDDLFERVKDTLLRGEERWTPTPATAASGGRIPAELISTLEEMTNRDLITALLYYENPSMTKSEMSSRSIELGRPLSSQWLDKHLAEDTRGLVVPVKTQEGKIAYKLSDQGRLKTEARMKELTANQGQGV